MAGLSAAARPVIPAFEVEFTGGDADGRCRGPLGELWSTPFERVAPVRSFPSFRGQVSFPGLYYAATMDAHVGFESWLERDVAMMLDFDPAVVAVLLAAVLADLGAGRRAAAACPGLLRPAGRWHGGGD